MIVSMLKRFYQFLFGVDWRLIRVVAEWRFVKSAYIWLFIVPLAARLLLPLAGEHDISIPWIGSDDHKTFHFDIGLPFSWRAFFFMALFFLIGWILYLLACPEIVKHYKSFGEFRSAHSGTGKINEYLHDAIMHATASRLDELVRDVHRQPEAVGALKPLGEKPVPPDVRQIVWEGSEMPPKPTPDERICKVFDAIVRVERLRNHKTCLTAAFFFLVGGILFARVTLESIVAFFRVAFF